MRLVTSQRKLLGQRADRELTSRRLAPASAMATSDSNCPGIRYPCDSTKAIKSSRNSTLGSGLIAMLTAKCAVCFSTVSYCPKGANWIRGIHGSRHPKFKTTTRPLRIDPKVKAAATDERGHRNLTSLIEVLILNHRSTLGLQMVPLSVNERVE